MENKYLIGIDIGGTTFKSALFTEKLEIFGTNYPTKDGHGLSCKISEKSAVMPVFST